MHDIRHPHDHDDPLGPGRFSERPTALTRDYQARAFTVGIGGPVGSGKTALLLALCLELRERFSLAAVTNDIFIQQLRAVPGDAEVTLRGRLLRRSRSMAWTEAEARVEDRLCATARITKSVVPTPR